MWKYTLGIWKFKYFISNWIITLKYYKVLQTVSIKYLIINFSITFENLLEFKYSNFIHASDI